MKKFVSILLAVVLIFSVLTCVGCEADKKEENTITYYHYEPYVSPVSILIYQYNEKCKNVQIESILLSLIILKNDKSTYN